MLAKYRLGAVSLRWCSGGVAGMRRITFRMVGKNRRKMSEGATHAVGVFLQAGFDVLKSHVIVKRQEFQQTLGRRQSKTMKPR